MALTLSLADAALREDYQPELRDQLNSEHEFLMQIESHSRDVEGRRAVLSLHTGRNSSAAARLEGGALPAAGSQTYTEERVLLKYNYGRMQINGPVIKAMKSDRGSFVRAVASETDGMVTDVKENVSRQLFNDATQSIAQAGVTSSANLIVLAAGTTSVQMRQFFINQVVDIGTTGSPATVAAAVTITAVDAVSAPPTITVSGSAVTTSASHYVSVNGSAGAELTGIRSIVSDVGTLFNVDPSTVPVWKAHRSQGASGGAGFNSGTSRVAVSNLFEKAIDEIVIASGKAPSLIVTSHGVVRGYAAQLQDQRRFNDNVELKGGFSVPTISAGSVTLPLLADRFAPANAAFLINTAHITQHQSSDWEFMDDDGSVLNRVDGYDAYEATLFKYHELTTDQRNTHGVVEDITES
jgi:hypothetical protein